MLSMQSDILIYYYIATRGLTDINAQLLSVCQGGDLYQLNHKQIMF